MGNKYQDRFEGHSKISCQVTKFMYNRGMRSNRHSGDDRHQRTTAILRKLQALPTTDCTPFQTNVNNAQPNRKLICELLTCELCSGIIAMSKTLHEENTHGYYVLTLRHWHFHALLWVGLAMREKSPTKWLILATCWLGDTFSPPSSTFELPPKK